MQNFALVQNQTAPQHLKNTYLQLLKKNWDYFIGKLRQACRSFIAYLFCFIGLLDYS